MTVSFTGNTFLQSTDMGKFFTLGKGYGAGRISYEFSTAIKSKNFAILHVYYTLPGTEIPDIGGAVIRVEQNFAIESAVNGLSLYLGSGWRPVYAPSPYSGYTSAYITSPQSELTPFHDGKVHRVVISWNTGTTPKTVEMSIDDIPLTASFVSLGVYTTLDPVLSYPNGDPARILHGEGDEVLWSIGKDLSGEMLNVGSGAGFVPLYTPFIGTLDRLTVALYDDATVDRHEEVHTDVICILRPGEIIPVTPMDAKKEKLDHSVRMVPDCVFIDSLTERNSGPPERPPQLSLGGNSTTFPVNFGPTWANDFIWDTTTFEVFGVLGDV